MKDIPADGDCALHAIVDQLHVQGQEQMEEYTAKSLRSLACQKLMENPVDKNFFVHDEFDSFDSYLKQQSASGTWCDELMIICISDVVDRQIMIVDDNRHETLIVPSNASTSSNSFTRSPLFLGLMTDYHYVSLVPIQNHGAQMHDMVAEIMVDETPNLKTAVSHSGYPKCWTLDQWRPRLLIMRYDQMCWPSRSPRNGRKEHVKYRMD